MATAEKCFHVPSEQEIDKLLTDKDNINTQKATKLSVKCFLDYLREQALNNISTFLKSTYFKMVSISFPCTNVKRFQ
jgi:hypothetical protein